VQDAQKGCSARPQRVKTGSTYPLGDVEDLNDARTTLAGFFSILPKNKQAVRRLGNGLPDSLGYGSNYGLTLMRSLIKSKVSLGTTFFATNSPFTRYGRFVTMRSATSLETPSTSTISPADALLTFMEEDMG